jgi:hypothetical protein
MARLHCLHCGSNHTKRNGPAPLALAPNRIRYQCHSCKSPFYVDFSVTVSEDQRETGTLFDLFDDDEDQDFHDESETIHPNNYDQSVDEENPIDYAPSDIKFIRDSDYIESIKKHKKIVITTAQNNAEVDEDFLGSLKTYCSENDAALVVIPIRYKNPSMDQSAPFEYSESIREFLVDNNIHFSEYALTILCDLKLLATAVNPLSTLDPFSKGNSLILGHSQLQLRTLNRGKDRKYPPVLSTTGAVTKKNYSSTKSGIQADFNHSMSAAVIELSDDSIFFLRHLNFDEKLGGFYDLDSFYGVSSVKKDCSVEAIVTGDTHVKYHDREVYEATFSGKGMVNSLKPSYLISHDTADFHNRSHHTIKDPFSNYNKVVQESESVEQEMFDACEFLHKTTPQSCKNIVVASNHDMHLDQWLRTTDIRTDPKNAKIFHELSFLIYKEISENKKIPMAFEVFYKSRFDGENIIFLKESDSFKLHGIELANHGHQGAGGSRGSSAQFAKFPDKMITGHSHSPCINKGSYVVGTSSIFHMEYVKGHSSWDHAHCIIHKNGKRQLVFMRNGKFRA